ncbi:MAG: hypothetical protein HQK59_01715 [Deltaproteobacteria bacterium]|nr:hypothetical protein [Deltaproteobacteria bacterium]
MDLGTDPLRTDKRSACYQIRIPDVLNHHLEELSLLEKAKLNEDILRVLALAVHNHRFDPGMYLKS